MGTGWAPFRGGPMAYAKTLGEKSVEEKLIAFLEEDGAIYDIPESLNA